jgi:hypothetical protein
MCDILADLDVKPELKGVEDGFKSPRRDREVDLSVERTAQPGTLCSRRRPLLS